MKASATDPRASIPVAVDALVEVRAVLERVVVSSESFDYPAAKEALALLEKKIRYLGKIESSLRTLDPLVRHRFDERLCHRHFFLARLSSRKTQTLRIGQFFREVHQFEHKRISKGLYGGNVFASSNHNF